MQTLNSYLLKKAGEISIMDNCDICAHPDLVLNNCNFEMKMCHVFEYYF